MIEASRLGQILSILNCIISVINNNRTASKLKLMMIYSDQQILKVLDSTNN